MGLRSRTLQRLSGRLGIGVDLGRDISLTKVFGKKTRVAAYCAAGYDFRAGCVAAEDQILSGGESIGTVLIPQHLSEIGEPPQEVIEGFMDVGEELALAVAEGEPAKRYNQAEVAQALGMHVTGDPNFRTWIYRSQHTA